VLGAEIDQTSDLGAVVAAIKAIAQCLRSERTHDVDVSYVERPLTESYDHCCFLASGYRDLLPLGVT
jgi:hypothetical protein